MKRQKRRNKRILRMLYLEDWVNGISEKINHRRLRVRRIEGEENGLET